MALTKLKLQACEDAACKKKIGSAFSVMFNPEKYSRSYTADLEEIKTIGGVGKHVFKGHKPETLKFEFLFDTTGVVAPPAGLKGKSVSDMLKTFRESFADINGTIHRPPFIQLSWGTLVFNCQLKDYSEDYTLFKDDGTPIRAKINATFFEVMDATETASKTKTSSPDMTHTITVSAGDTLPALCDRVYSDVTVYQQVARHNKINSLTFLKPGTVLHFPPLKQ